LPRVLITGASGFIGFRAYHAFLRAGWTVRATTRRSIVDPVPQVEWRVIEDLGCCPDWSDLLTDVDCVVHLAGRAHVLDERKKVDSEFYRINSQGTLRLAEQAAAHGVRRFVFTSSVGVHGLHSPPGRGLREDDPLTPHDSYTRSKLEAEKSLFEVNGRTGLEVVVLRPCLVYGPGAPGNFGRLVRLIKSGVPLPFALVRSRRSLLYVENLADALICCARHPMASGQVFLISDDDLSIPELIREISRGLGTSPRLLSVPVPVIRWLGIALGRKAELDRLLSSLCVDTSRIRQVLDWRPRYSASVGLSETVSWYRQNS
jgi:nucleoside-diphosphate-sugar epimerase